MNTVCVYVSVYECMSVSKIQGTRHEGYLSSGEVSLVGAILSPLDLMLGYLDMYVSLELSYGGEKNTRGIKRIK